MTAPRDAERVLAAMTRVLDCEIGEAWRLMHAMRKGIGSSDTPNARTYYVVAARESEATLLRLLAVRRAARGGRDGGGA